MIQDFLVEIFSIHEELDGGGERACAWNFGSTSQEQD
jgi:hypothetical protein